MPTKPPLSATRRSSSSVLLRGRSHSARQPVWLIEMGSREARIASRQVRSPLCDRSTITRASLMAADDLAPERREAAVVGGHRPVAEVVGLVVGQLDDADAEPLELRDPADVVADGDGVLEAVDDADLPVHPCPVDVGGRQDLRQVGGVLGQVAVPDRDLLEGVGVRLHLAHRVAEGDVDRGEPGGVGVGQGPVVDAQLVAAGVELAGRRERLLGVRVVEDPERVHDRQVAGAHRTSSVKSARA